MGRSHAVDSTSGPLTFRVFVLYRRLKPTSSGGLNATHPPPTIIPSEKLPEASDILFRLFWSFCVSDICRSCCSFTLRFSPSLSSTHMTPTLGHLVGFSINQNRFEGPTGEVHRSPEIILSRKRCLTLPNWMTRVISAWPTGGKLTCLETRLDPSKSTELARCELDAMERDARFSFQDQHFRIAVQEHQRQAREAVNQAVRESSKITML